MDIYLLFLIIGAVGGASAVGIAWFMWWEREKSKSICKNCWPE